MIAILRTAFVLPVLLIAACSGARPTATPPAVAVNGRGDMNTVMSSWKGRRAYEAVAMWGMPDSITREGTLGMLRWRADAAAIGSKAWGQPFSGESGEDGQPQRRQDWPVRCARVLSVDAQEVVQFASWSRSEGCSTDPADYLPPP
jgi:hypothetical protein